MTHTLTEQLDKNPLFDTISDIAYERGEQVWVVGGFVRDTLLDLPNKDLDFTIIGNLEEFAKDVAKALSIPEEDIKIFSGYGTVNMYDKNTDTEIEIVRARKESYSDESRKPKVDQGTLEEDIARRDFTINTLAVSLNRTTYGEIVDIYSGQTDLEEGTIKTPLSPLETFDDDPLRIFRMVRFSARFDFKIDPITYEGAKNSIHRLKIVSMERMTDEFLKIIRHKNAIKGLQLLMDVGAFKMYIPELVTLQGQEQRADYHHKDVWGHTLDVVGKIVDDPVYKDTDTTWLRIAALFHDIGKPSTKKFIDGIGWTFHGHEEQGRKMIPEIFSRIHLSKDKSDYVATLAGLHGRFRGIERDEVTDSAIRRLINEAGEYFEDLIKLYLCDYSTHNNRNLDRIRSVNKKVQEKLEGFMDRESKRFLKTVSLVSGKEIMSVLNLQPGPQIGIIKNAVEEEMLEGRITTKEEALQFVKEYKL